MQTIKKYANRKLYHLNRKQYITLDGIATLIQSGEQVQIVDNETGDDITASVLAQVALHARQPHRLPSTGILADLIRTGSDTITEVGRSLLSNFGGQSLLDSEISRRIDRLEQTGTISADEAARLRLLLLQHPSSSPLNSAPDLLPSRRDIDQLHIQLEQLAHRVDELLSKKNVEC